MICFVIHFYRLHYLQKKYLPIAGSLGLYMPSTDEGGEDGEEAASLHSVGGLESSI